MSSGSLSRTNASTRRLWLVQDQAVDQFDVMGLQIGALSFEEAVHFLLTAPHRGRLIRVHFAAMQTLAEASHNDSLRHSLSRADLVLTDETPLVWLGRYRGKPIERIRPSKAMATLLDRGQAYDYRHFFYGGTEDSVATVAAAMTRRLPELKIAGLLHAPRCRSLTNDEVVEVATRINAAEPDFVWVGARSPLQDEWLTRFRPLLDAPVLIGVGPVFKGHSGFGPAAPAWSQRLGLDWAFDLAAEPRRLLRERAMALRCIAGILTAEAAGGRRSKDDRTTSKTPARR